MTQESKRTTHACMISSGVHIAIQYRVTAPPFLLAGPDVPAAAMALVEASALLERRVGPGGGGSGEKSVWEGGGK